MTEAEAAEAVEYEVKFMLTLTQLTALKASYVDKQAADARAKQIAQECGLTDPGLQVNMETGEVRGPKAVSANRAARRQSPAPTPLSLPGTARAKKGRK